MKKKIKMMSKDKQVSIIVATGANIGEPLAQLKKAKELLKDSFSLISASSIYKSKAVDYENQPDFYNQVLELSAHKQQNPHDVLKILLSIENTLGRYRSTPKGPRVIDIDLIFYDFDILDTPELTLPHPRAFKRSFVMLPLKELPSYTDLNKVFNFPTTFQNEATRLNNA